MNQVFLLISFFKFNISLTALEVKCARYYCIPFPFHFLIISGHLCFKLPIAQTFFYFSIKLEGSSYWELTLLLHIVQVNTIPLSRGFTVLMISSSAILRFS